MPLRRRPLAPKARPSRWNRPLVALSVVCTVIVVIYAVAHLGGEPDRPRAPAPTTSLDRARHWARDATSFTVIGDSLAVSLQDEFTAAAAPYGIPVSGRAIGACGVLRGTQAQERLEPVSWTATCDATVQPILDEIGSGAPTLVLWLSSWDSSNRIVDGEPLRFGSKRDDPVFRRLIGDAVDQLSRGGSHVVFLTVPHRTTRPDLTGTFGGVPYVVEPESALERRSIDHLNQMLRRYVATHAHRTALVDLDTIVCRHRRPCPFTTAGVALRPVDGRHFAGPGPSWVSQRILSRLGLDP